ncbi:NADP-dependent phosphogluconate dehydrogenase [Parafilimonas sp.]|uniref:NADP-dependent phosphogluconate dehydrogenase n=1 Tax=Parafilimonas sp. TaxID=1969739 RepID=UPI0039E56420
MTDIFYDFGMIGLGVMGSNFLLNMADKGYKAIGFDLDAAKARKLEEEATPGTIVKGVNTLEEMVKQLDKPRRIMMLVPAGKPVDTVIQKLLPLIDKDDIIIDGGNSHYTDTLKRLEALKGKGIHFMGMGVSGGEEGARKGPSIMPGGDWAAWKRVQPVLEAISAKVNDEPCVAYMGKDAAGHYVKMVHNGIEYAVMQLISEAYDVMKRWLGLSNSELAGVFKQWNEEDLESFLIEITSKIFLRKDDETGKYLIEVISDKAGSKGTGKWTSQDSMELPVPVPTIDIAVVLRIVSDFKEERLAAAELYQPKTKPFKGNKDAEIKKIKEALYFATIVAYAQGLSMLHKASSELNMDIPLADVIKIWRGGCIIRSSLLEVFYKAYKKDETLPNILLNKSIARLIKKTEKNARAVARLAMQNKIPAMALTSAIGYFDAYCTASMPTNLIQAQRDFFGAHTYQRIDREGIFHTEWEETLNP